MSDEMEVREACGATVEVLRWDRSFIIECNRPSGHDGSHERWTGGDRMTWELTLKSAPETDPE